MTSYFDKRESRAAGCRATACAIETAVIRDMEILLEHGVLPDCYMPLLRNMLDQLPISKGEVGETWYEMLRVSKLLSELHDLFHKIGQKPGTGPHRFHDKPADYLADLGLTPTPAGGLDLETGELVVPLANGYELRSGWIDQHDPDALPAGDYLSVRDSDGKQVLYEDAADLFADPVEGRKKLLHVILACLGQANATCPLG